jgi:hypothetical protein
MIEILQIIIFFLLFNSLLLFPLNIFNQDLHRKHFNILEVSVLNLGINLNILLLISLINYPFSRIWILIGIGYFSVLFYNYMRKKFLKKILKKKILFIPLFIYFFIFLILSLDISNQLFLGWDAKYFYYIKALFFVDDKTLYNLKEFSPSQWHPHFGSYLWGFFWSISFLEIEYFGRLSYLFIFCFSIYYVSKLNENYVGHLFIFLILLILFYQYKYFSGLQEIILFSFLIIISKTLDKLSLSGNYLFLIIILLFSNLMLWTKSEGLVYLFIILSLILIIKKISFKYKLGTIFTVILLLILKLTIYDLAELNNNNTQNMFYNFNYLLSLNFEILFYKFINILIWLLYYIASNIFFISFIFIIIFDYFFSKKNVDYLEYEKILTIYLISIFLFIFSAYLFREMEIIQSIRTTMDRLVMTASGFLIYPSLRIIKKTYNL